VLGAEYYLQVTGITVQDTGAFTLTITSGDPIQGSKANGTSNIPERKKYRGKLGPSTLPLCSLWDIASCTDRSADGWADGCANGSAEGCAVCRRGRPMGLHPRGRGRTDPPAGQQHRHVPRVPVQRGGRPSLLRHHGRSGPTPSRGRGIRHWRRPARAQGPGPEHQSGVLIRDQLRRGDESHGPPERQVLPFGHHGRDDSGGRMGPAPVRAALSVPRGKEGEERVQEEAYVKNALGGTPRSDLFSR
jgi:hypothetical protein